MDNLEIDNSGSEMNQRTDEPLNHRTKKRECYSLEFKYKVITEYKKNQNFSLCSRLFGIDRRIIKHWHDKKEELEKSKHKRLRCKLYKNSKCYFPELETKLYTWAEETRSIGGCLSGVALIRKATEIYNEIYSDAIEKKEFNGTSGWLKNFLKRHSLVRRRITTTGRELPTNTLAIIKDFFETCNRLRVEPHFTRDCIINMDETSIYLDFPTSYTYAKKGSKRVKAVTSGAERTRLSAAFGATASGIKLPIYIIVPRKTELSNYEPPENVVLVYKTGATFDQYQVADYLDLVIKKFINNRRLETGKFTMFIDSAKCHLTQTVSAKYSEINVNRMFIPPRMTNLLQPADVAWFANIKKAYNSKWCEWFMTADKTYTKNNNMRSPGYANCKLIQI
jgi:hypothetical protein